MPVAKINKAPIQTTQSEPPDLGVLFLTIFVAFIAGETLETAELDTELMPTFAIPSTETAEVLINAPISGVDGAETVGIETAEATDTATLVGTSFATRTALETAEDGKVEATSAPPTLGTMIVGASKLIGVPPLGLCAKETLGGWLRLEYPATSVKTDKTVATKMNLLALTNLVNFI